MKKTWLQEHGHHKEMIGGRATDISMIPLTLYGLVRESFAINKVPEKILSKLERLKVEFENSEMRLYTFIDLVQEYYEQD